jgi:hypothetical protein
MRKRVTSLLVSASCLIYIMSQSYERHSASLAARMTTESERSSEQNSWSDNRLGHGWRAMTLLGLGSNHSSLT